MRRLLVDPGMAVTPNFFSALVRLNIEEFRRVGAFVPRQDIVNTERDVLFIVLPRKRGEARVESLSTVLQNPLRTELSGGGETFDLPFPPEVIDMAADNFDRLPQDTRELLFEDGWTRIRSSPMLPAVRKAAEAGDGPALLRWREPMNRGVRTRSCAVRPPSDRKTPMP